MQTNQLSDHQPKLVEGLEKEVIDHMQNHISHIPIQPIALHLKKKLQKNKASLHPFFAAMCKRASPYCKAQEVNVKNNKETNKS
jgi:nitrate reductase assembly molybdenum cofactor insertion protein NarJ